MKRFALALAAAAVLAATPALAGPIDEIVRDRGTAVGAVRLPEAGRDAGRIVTSEHDGETERARYEAVRIVPYTHEPEDLRGNGGR